MKALLIGDIHHDAKQLLEQHTRLEQTTTEQFLKARSYPNIEVVILRTFTPLQETEIQKLPKLKQVVSCSVGIDNINHQKLQEKNIQLIHCSGTNANSVAEHTMYLLMSLLREDQKKPYAELKGKTVGILGFGAIGKRVAKKLLGFETRVIAFDVIPQDPVVVKQLGTTMVAMDQLLQESDIITIHVPLNEHTKKLVNAACFQKMKKGSFFINTSRTEVIDERALIQEWERGRFRGVGVDVCSPQLKEKLKTGNVTITDHCAAQGEDSFREQCVKPVEEFVAKIKTTGIPNQWTKI